MQIVNNDSKLCDLLTNEPTLVAVINRFGITLGVGDKTIARICDEKGIDKDFFTTILNTFINEDYFPDEVLGRYKAAYIVDYLNKTDAYYENYLIPNVERHFNFLMARGNGANSSLSIIYKFFLEVKEELLKSIKADREVLFPKALRYDGDEQMSANVASVTDYQEDSIESKISDLLNMFVMHISGEYDNNLAHAVLIALFGLKKDISQNNRIRARILKPIVSVIEASKNISKE